MLCVSKQFAHDISIHAPRTGSDDNLQSVCVICHISIHAPRTGSDQPQAGLWRHTKDFNPRSPHGEQQDKQQHISGTTAFQSTLPARGATLFALSSTLRCDNFNPRSPHGERPSSSSQSFRIPSNFNPRSPHGERRIAWNSKTARSYFNPRSPHGERLRRVRLPCAGRAYFNPRSPHGERHGVLGYSPIAFEFQSTLPARGATAASTVSTSVTRTFQSTLPARGATRCTFPESRSPGISIHAPRTGSDPAASQSRQPPAISTHAPRTGSDGLRGQALT